MCFSICWCTKAADFRIEKFFAIAGSQYTAKPHHIKHQNTMNVLRYKATVTCCKKSP